MVLESLGAWSSVENEICILAADGRIEAIILQFKGVYGDVFKTFEVINPQSLELLKGTIDSSFKNFELISSKIDRDGQAVHALHIVAS